MLPAGLLKNRRDWLAAAAAGQTVQFNLQYLHISCKCVHTHVLHGCVHVCAQLLLLLLIIASLKKPSNKKKSGKKGNEKKKERGESWWVGGGGVSRDGARGWGELTEGRQRACDRATQVSH